MDQQILEVGPILYWYKLSRVLSFAGINFRDPQMPKLTLTSMNFEWAHSENLWVQT